jgi:hypothetical protein
VLTHRRAFLAGSLGVLAGACAPPGRAGAASPSGTAPLPPPPKLAHRGPVARLSLTNDARQPSAERVVSFGQVFAPGQVAADTRLQAKMGASGAEAQLDAKALYPDGSVRHAVVSVLAPTLGAGETREVELVAGDPAPPVAPVPPRLPEVRVRLALKEAGEPPREMEVNLARVAATARGAPWLSGPLVQEIRRDGPLAYGLQVVFDVWMPAVGPARVDVIFHNDTAQNDQIATRVYDAAIFVDGRPAFEAKDVKHHRYQTWRRTVLAEDAPPPPRVTPDTGRLIELGAVPHYGRIRPDSAAAHAFHQDATAEAAPLRSTGNLTPYMPTTGGRPDIGPLPAWAVFYLLDPTRENRETLLANADVAGAIPWHVRDMGSDGPISIDEHPEIWLDYRGKPKPGVLNAKYDPDDGVWTIDDAHQPSLTYLPYLITGSQYYRDELAMQAGFVLLGVNDGYRGGSAGIVLPSQLRAIAWDLRTLASAAYILPTGDRFQRYFQAKLEGNLAEIMKRYVKGDVLAGAGELIGYVPGAYDEDHTAPWQDDYLAMVLGWAYAMGFAQARPILAWMSNFIAGRFTNAARGYDPTYGTPSELHVYDTASGRRINTWAAAFKASFDPAAAPVATLDYPDWAGGYAALARAALASILNVAPSPRAEAAYAYVVAHTPKMESSYPKEPAFAITPIRDAGA